MWHRVSGSTANVREISTPPMLYWVYGTFLHVKSMVMLCVCVCVSGFNIGSASTNVAASSTQSSPATGAVSTSTASTVSSGPAAVNSKSVTSSSRRDINQDVCNVPGFTVLQWLLSHHPHIPHVYFMMMALLVGQPVQQLPPDIQVSY